MHRIYKKEYNVILRSFISRAFVGTIVVSSLFACRGVSKEELEEAKEETEKIKKELETKITALEGRTSAAITADNYTHIQDAVGLKPDGTLDKTKGVVKDFEDFAAVLKARVGLNGANDLDPTIVGSLAEDIRALNNFITVIRASVGLDATGNLDVTAVGSLVKTVDELPAKIVKGVNALGNKFKNSRPQITIDDTNL